MGWIIENKKNLYRVWSTISDDWITDWNTRNEILKYLIKRKRSVFNKEIKNLKETFPEGFCNKKGKIYIKKD